MPRNHPGNSSLRNRNRITNKTRLKIHHGTIDADALIDDALVLEPSAFTAGVEPEDANVSTLSLVFVVGAALL
jgi:enhancer of polycomb-like protein